MPPQDERTIGWTLDPEQRQELLGRFPPAFDRAVAHHVTLRSEVDDDEPLPGPVEGEIVGRSSDDAGVEAMVVTVDGVTDRPGGGTFHITWSLAEGRRPEESNDVIAERGWDIVDPSVPVALHPARFV